MVYRNRTDSLYNSRRCIGPVDRREANAEPVATERSVEVRWADMGCRRSEAARVVGFSRAGVAQW